MRLAVFFSSGAVVLGLVGACSGAHEAKHDSISTVAVPLNDPPRLDVPGLLALSIEEVGHRLGPPRPVPPALRDPTLLPQPQQHEPLDSAALFQYRGLNIVVSYDYPTRQVKDLMLMGDNEDELMNQGRLQLGSANYLVLPIFQQSRPTELMGLRVLPSKVR
jgi:hypothetical protein